VATNTALVSVFPVAVDIHGDRVALTLPLTLIAFR